MKNYSHLPFLIIFLTSMSLGFRAGSNFILPGKLNIQSSHTTPSAKQLSILASGQRSILMVVVDAFDAEEPNLESAWLILYLPENPRITLMPIFPTLSRDISSDERIKEKFSVDRPENDPVLSEDFLLYLKSMEFWWSGYILLDTEALNQISVSLVAPGSKGKWGPSRSQTQEDLSVPITQLPSALKSGKVSAADQARFFQELCKRASGYTSSTPDTEHFALEDLVPDHLNLDFSIEQLNKEIQVLQKHGSNLSCEFPLFYSDPVTIRSTEGIGD